MRTIFIFILACILTSFSGTKKDSGISLRKLDKLLCNNWSYEYSINSGSKQIISDYDFAYTGTQVFFRIEFWKFSKKELVRFYEHQNIDYKRILKGNRLEGIEMFGNYKGCSEYPILLNDSVDLNGDLISCEIQTYHNCDNKTPVKVKSFFIDKLTKDSLIISGYMGDARTNKIIYKRVKK